ncbi:hypothetical protein BD324DRAFT_408679 [Kockovaella imperatae]|uniref:Uncharacterized protein n=1 Tax=Kockovaella imperatae TaxID=4999 RepID=A0A1Y1UIP6_9TREE|nr:hypothetical protein BD324DRAFT_408679 [Kockovaella imperatae]ORX37933.1 hypothetical protein BD324DRAFT_408679 [Kockovaella imperatae]
MPLFAHLETFHLTVKHYEETILGPRGKNLPVGSIFWPVIEGIFSLCSARHVRFIQMMALKPQPCKFCGFRCQCPTAHFRHGYDRGMGDWTPEGSRIEKILSRWPLETYDLPFLPKQLPIQGMRMTASGQFGRVHPVSFLFNGDETTKEHDFDEYLAKFVQHMKEKKAHSRRWRRRFERTGPKWYCSGMTVAQQVYFGDHWVDAVYRLTLPKGMSREQLCGAFEAHIVGGYAPFQLDSGKAWRQWTSTGQ